MQTTQALKIQESARSQVYRRLADTYRMPEPGLGKVLGELETALFCLGSRARENAAALRGSCPNDADLHLIRLEYTALFVGPFLAPAAPYGSVYLEGKRRLMGDSTVAARAHYLSLGLDLSEEFKEAPDHICAELEFMHVSVCQSRQAIEGLDNHLLADSLRQQRVFLSEHLGAWIPAFTDNMVRHASTGYYRHLAALTRTFIAEEIEVLVDILAADQVNGRIGRGRQTQTA